MSMEGDGDGIGDASGNGGGLPSLSIRTQEGPKIGKGGPWEARNAT